MKSALSHLSLMLTIMTMAGSSVLDFKNLSFGQYKQYKLLILMFFNLLTMFVVVVRAAH